MIFIYKLIDPITFDIRYIGKTNNLTRRYNAHITRSKTHKYHSARWINSLIKNNLKPMIEIIEVCNNDNWVNTEKYWIEYYRNFYDLTNILEGGQSNATYGRLNKPWSDEQRINNKIARTGIPVNHTKEGDYNRKIGRRKYFDSIKKHVYQYDLNKILIQKWDSTIDASKQLNINNSNIIKVCNGKRNHTGGFFWSYDLI